MKPLSWWGRWASFQELLAALPSVGLCFQVLPELDKLFHNFYSFIYLFAPTVQSVVAIRELKVFSFIFMTLDVAVF